MHIFAEASAVSMMATHISTAGQQIIADDDLSINPICELHDLLIKKPWFPSNSGVEIRDELHASANYANRAGYFISRPCDRVNGPFLLLLEIQSSGPAAQRLQELWRMRTVRELAALGGGFFLPGVDKSLADAGVEADCSTTLRTSGCLMSAPNGHRP